MKAKIEVTELTHDELVCILSSAFYNNYILTCKVAEDVNTTSVVNKLRKEQRFVCCEDLWASVLLNGGSIMIVDHESEPTNFEDAYKNAYKGGNAHHIGYATFGDYGVTTYDVNLREFLSGCGSERAYKLLTNLLTLGGDYYDAFDLIQNIVFGEEIYG